MDLQDVGCEGMDWIELSGQGQVAGTCESGNESLCSIKCTKFFDWLQIG